MPLDVTNVASVAVGPAYCVAVKRDGRLRAWGSQYLTNVPASATNVIAVTVGASPLVLRRDGTVIDWNGTVRASNAAAIAAPAPGSTSGSGAALRSDGFLLSLSGTTVTRSNVIAIAGGSNSVDSIHSDGTVSAASISLSSLTGLTNIVAQAEPGYYNCRVWLKADGTVVAHGFGPQTNVPSGLSNVVAVASGTSHGVALKSDGTIVAWGDNTFGQIDVPSGLSRVVAIATGSHHSLALKEDGGVAAWGNNSSGQTNVPPNLTNVAAIFAGTNVSVAIVGASPPTLLSQPPDEIVWSGRPATFTVKAVGTPPLRYQWQFNGEIIEGATNSFYRIEHATPALSGVYNVVVSNPLGTAVSQEVLLLARTDLAISEQPTDQAAWFGGSVALRFTVQGPQPLSYQWFFIGQPIDGATNSMLVLTNFGLEHAGDYWATVNYPHGSRTSSVARLSAVAASAWGSASDGINRVPTNLQTVAAIAAGGWHNLFLKEDGTVGAWGNDAYGQRRVPPELSNVVAIAAGYYHSLALRVDGTVVGWGSNQYGRISIPPGLSNAVCISAGGYHSLALREDATVVAWGDSRFGQTLVPPDLTNVLSIAAGEYSSLALRADGTLAAWGFPADGLQTEVLQSLSNVVGIAAGRGHWLALRGDGTVVAWGSDYCGQTKIPQGLSNVVAVAAGDNHSLALRRDGTVVAWGYNVSGQTNVPPGLSKVVAISAGVSHNVALVEAGLGAPIVQMFNPSRSDGVFSVQTLTVRGKSYYLQYRDSFTSPLWMLRPPVPGDGTAKTLIDSSAFGTHRFYRAWQKP